jgi:hypothetical protein
MEYLLSVSTNVDEDPASQVARAVARQTLDMIATDKDDHYILDYFGATCASMVPNRREIGNAIWRNATSAAEHYSQVGPPRVAAKYDWLVEYLRPRLRHWDVASS